MSLSINSDLTFSSRTLWAFSPRKTCGFEVLQFLLWNQNNCCKIEKFNLKKRFSFPLETWEILFLVCYESVFCLFVFLLVLGLFVRGGVLHYFKICWAHTEVLIQSLSFCSLIGLMDRTLPMLRPGEQLSAATHISVTKTCGPPCRRRFPSVSWSESSSSGECWAAGWINLSTACFCREKLPLASLPHLHDRLLLHSDLHHHRLLLQVGTQLNTSPKWSSSLQKHFSSGKIFMFLSGRKLCKQLNYNLQICQTLYSFCEKNAQRLIIIRVRQHRSDSARIILTLSTSANYVYFCYLKSVNWPLLKQDIVFAYCVQIIQYFCLENYNL